MMRIDEKHRGLALIITLTTLMGLISIGIPFIRISATDRLATKNYSDKVVSRLYAFAGIDRAIAAINAELSQKGFTDFSNTVWRFPHDPGTNLTTASLESTPLETGETTGISFETLVDDGIRISQILGISTNDVLGGNSLKVLDSSGQLNLNSHIAIPQAPPTAANQLPSNAILNKMTAHLAELCGFSIAESATVANALVDPNWDPVYNDPNAPLPKRWQSKTQITNLMSTLGLSASQQIQQNFLDRITVTSWINPKTITLASFPTSTTSIPTYIHEARSPININIASLEVLACVLWDLESSPQLLDNTAIARSEFGEGSIVGGGGGANEHLFDETNITSAPVRFRMQIAPSKDKALEIAQKIVDFRRITPIKNWNIWRKFIESQIETGSSATPVPPAVQDVIDKLHPNPNTPEIQNPDVGKEIWDRAFWDTIISNSNPDAVDNRFNPTLRAAFKTVKSDLFSNPGSGNTRTHTTEFSFNTTGAFEISSLGFVRSRTLGTIARTIVVYKASLMDIIQHSTQQDFETSTTIGTTAFAPSFSGTTSFPNVVAKNLNMPNDTHVGRVEPAISFTTAGNTLYASQFVTARGGTPALPASDSQRFTTFPGGGLQTMNIGPNSIRSANNNLVNDGILSDVRQALTPGETRYHSIAGMPAGVTRQVNVNNPATANISYYQGTLEFWVKLTESSDAQVGSALLSATLVNPNPPYTEDADDPNRLPHEFSEGVQFYIFKNTLGELRFSRVYFCLTFNANSQLVGTHFTTDADGWNPAADDWQAGVEASGFFFPHPRQDIVVRANDVNWPAHTWHHVVVSWSNINPNNPMTVTIDGDTKTTVLQNIDFTPGIDDPEFCLLNERAPRDCLNIGGYFRPQVDQRGIFKFDSNVHFAANATISGVRTYDSVINVPFTNRFSNSTYTHSFAIPQAGALGTFSWTSYPDRADGGAHTTVNISVFDANNNNIGSFSTPTDSSQEGFDGDGIPLNQLPVFANSRLQYTLNINPQNNDIPVVESVSFYVLNTTVQEILELP